MLPTLFVSHGAPTLPVTDTPAKRFLGELPARLPTRPKAILAVSAHWETEIPTVNLVAVNSTIHDFGGFAPELYELRYPAPGSAELAERVGELLAAEGVACRVDRSRGLDHGAWTPLLLMYPQADVPVVQLSVQPHLGPAHHLAVGRALQALRSEAVLVIGSGSFTHDLSEFRHRRHELEGAEPDWVASFAAWFDTALTEGRTNDLLAYRRLAPNAARNHPTEEHLLPLYVALGAAGDRPSARRLHASVTHGVLRMDVYAFGAAAGEMAEAQAEGTAAR
jgi:4,5-DOPA dioxygenase extradiol